MKVIATHLNADFDGFAAMIGFLKIHPEAVLVFPGSKEPGIATFLRDTGMEIPEVPLKDVKNVSHLFLVDASREDRIGELSSILKYSHDQKSKSTIIIRTNKQRLQAKSCIPPMLEQLQRLLCWS